MTRSIGLAGAVLVVTVGSCSATSKVDTTLVSRETREWSVVTCDNDGWNPGAAPAYATPGTYVLWTMRGEPGGSCDLAVEPLTMRDETGGLALLGVLNVHFDVRRVPDPPFECGGRTFTAVLSGSYRYRFETDGQLLTFDDGGVVRLIPESAIEVTGEVTGECFDEVGRWEGIDGSYAGRTGTYRWVYDTIQTELKLVES